MKTGRHMIHDRAIRGMVLFLKWRHKLFCIMVVLLKIAMQSSSRRHFRNIPQPFTSSVVNQISASFSNFYNPIKVKFPGEKGKT